MSDILIQSKQGEAYALATHLANEGHNVSIYIQNQKNKNLGRGCPNPERIYSFTGRVAPDLLFFDNVVTREEYGDFRRAGGAVFERRRIHEVLESPTPFAKLVAEKLTKLSFGEATGVDIIVEGWFNGQIWSSPFTFILNYTRLMEGDKGPLCVSTGCFIWLEEENSIVNMVLRPLVEFLQRGKYIGPFAAHCTCTKEDIFYKHFRTSLHPSAFPAYTELIRGSLYSFLKSVSSGEMLHLPVHSNRVAIAVGLSAPPYPYRPTVEDPFQGQVLLTLEQPALPHVWLTDVMYPTLNQPVYAGLTGQIGYITAWGEISAEARRRVYRTLDRAQINPEVQYRLDIARNADEQIHLLKQWGWVHG